MKDFILCAYDPLDPNSEPQPVSDRWQPHSLKRARAIIACYNKLVAAEHDLHEVLAIFPRSALRRYRLALYDPITGKRQRWEGPAFRLGTEGERQAKIAVAEFNRLTADSPDVTLCLGAFPWRGKAVKA